VRMGKQDVATFDPVTIPDFTRKEYTGVFTRVVYPYHLFSLNAQELEVDFRLITEGRESALLNSCVQVYGKYPVFVEEGAVVRDSIIMQGSVVKKGSVINKAIIAENVDIGENTQLGVGEEVPNVEKPKIYNSGLVTIGENSVIPDGIKIGKNTAISGVTVPEDYTDGMLPGGGIIIKAGEDE